MTEISPYKAELYDRRWVTELDLLHQGKVRDVFAVGTEYLLIVASDRLSAFDVILPDTIPHKGEWLTRISNFWFERMKQVAASHQTNIDIREVLDDGDLAETLRNRAVVVKRLERLPLEAIVRGYIIGSGWKDYLSTGGICGIELPESLAQAQQLPDALFTPSTKADVGDHDENVAFEAIVDALGKELADEVRSTSLKIYETAREFARSRGIIIADTKFEFGLDSEGRLCLIDELLTPDSSRFWPLEHYRPGISPPSFDKQFVRDYLETLDWDKTAPGPHLPDTLIEATAAKYREACDRLMGPNFGNQTV